MTISFSGLASGLDTSSWVESLTALKQAKVTSLQAEKEEVLLSKETLNSIKSFFNSFRSIIEKVTDTKFNVASMDLFAQNIATSANLEILTATATTDAVEGVYDVKVDKLATATQVTSSYQYYTTRVETTTATLNSKLVDIGVTAGRIGVTVDSIEHTIDLTNNDTIATFIEKLQNIGVESSFNEESGVFSINIDSYDINDIDNTNIVDALHLSEVNKGYVTENKLQISKEETVYYAANDATFLSELGVSAGTIKIRANDTLHDIAITNSSTLGSFIQDLTNKNIEASLDATGVFTLTDAVIEDQGTTGIIDALGLNIDIYSKSQQTGNLQLETVTTTTTTATRDTYLKDIGTGITVNNNDNVIVKNSNGETTTIDVNSTTKIGDLLTAMSNAGLNANINSDGVIEISGGTISGGSFDAISAFGLEQEPYSAMVTGNALTETVEVAELVTLETQLVNDLKVSKGYLEVTDADGNIYYEKIYSGQTIADFMADMGNLGIYTSLDSESGVLTITGGAFKTLSDADVQDLVDAGKIVEADSSYIKGTDLLECLYGADVIGTNQIEVASVYSRTRALTQSVTNVISATLDTTLEKLGLTTEGTATFDVRGENVDINVTKSMTVQGLIDALEAEGVSAEWNTDTSRLTINNATITGGTSNLADVLNLETTISGKYVTSNTLYTQTTTNINATEATKLSEFGISNTMSNAERTVNLYDTNNNLIATTVVTENTTIGDLLAFANNNSVQASMTDGVISFNQGYIENSALESALGLEAKNINSFVLGSIKTTTTITSVTGDSKLGDIIATIGTENKVAGGYNLSFKGTSLIVASDTTLTQIIDQVEALGGTANIDSSGRLHIDGGNLSGSVAEALGVESITSTLGVDATGNTLSTSQSVTVNENTTLADLGEGDSKYILYADGVAYSTVNVISTKTFGEIFEELKAQGITATIDKGYITLVSDDGLSMGGELATIWGISNTTIDRTISSATTSTLAVTHTTSVVATLDTVLSNIGLTNSHQINILDKDHNPLATITIDNTKTIGDLFDTLNGYGIQGSITEGVINLYSANGNYATGTAMDKLGISSETIENYTQTISKTMTSSGEVIYSTDGHITGDTKVKDVVSGFAGLNKNVLIYNHGTNYSTVTITDTMTFDELFNAIEASSNNNIRLGLNEGVIEVNSAEGHYFTSAVLQALGINVTTSTVKVVGTSASSTVALTQTVSGNVTEDTLLSKFLTLGANGSADNRITVKDSNGNAVSTINVQTTWTMGDLMNAFNANGFSATLTNGVLSLNSSDARYIEGTIPNALGLDNQTITTVVNTTASSTLAVTHTTTGVATTETLLSSIGLTNTDKIEIHDKTGAVTSTITIDATKTLGDLFFTLSEKGIQANISDGVISLYSAEGSYATGTAMTKLGITSTVVENYTETTAVNMTSSSVITHTTTANITEDTLLSKIITLGANGTEANKITVNDVNGNSIGSIDVQTTWTMGDLMNALSSNGFNTNLTNGVLSLSSADGRYITGNIPTALGFDNTTVTNIISSTASSTVAITNTQSVVADLTTTLGSIGITNGMEIDIHDQNTVIATVTIASASTKTIGDLFNTLSSYGIQGSISDGVINLYSTNGNYATGNVMTTLGIGTTVVESTVTTAVSMTSSATVTFTSAITEDTLLKDFLTIGASGSKVYVHDAEDTKIKTITVTTTTTVGDLMNSLAQEGFSVNLTNGVISISSTTGETVTGDIMTAMGIGRNTITAGSTVGVNQSSTAQVTYTETITSSPATLDTLLKDILNDGGKSYNVTIKDDSTGTSSTVTINSTTCTVEGLISALNGKGIYYTLRINGTDAYLEYQGAQDGVYAMNGTGTLLNALGIGVEYKNTAKPITSTAAITYTETTTVTEDTLLSNFLTLGANGATANEVYVHDPNNNKSGTIAVQTTWTMGNLMNALSAEGFTAVLTNGVLSISSTSGETVTGDIITQLGIEQTEAPASSTVGVNQSSTAQVTYTETVTSSPATLDTLLKDILNDGGKDYRIIVDNGYADEDTLNINSATITVEGIIDVLDSHGIHYTLATSGTESYLKYLGADTPGANVFDDDDKGFLNLIGIRNSYTTIAVDFTSTAPITYTQTVNVTEDTLLSDFIENFDTIDKKILLTNETRAVAPAASSTITVQSTWTMGDLIDAFRNEGLNADLNNGVLTIIPTEDKGFLKWGDSSSAILDALGIDYGFYFHQIDNMSTEAITLTETISIETTGDLVYFKDAEVATMSTKIFDLQGVTFNADSSEADRTITLYRYNATAPTTKTTVASFVINENTTLNDLYSFFQTYTASVATTTVTDSATGAQYITLGYRNIPSRLPNCYYDGAILEQLGLGVNSIEFGTVSRATTSSEAITYCAEGDTRYEVIGALSSSADTRLGNDNITFANFGLTASQSIVVANSTGNVTITVTSTTTIGQLKSALASVGVTMTSVNWSNPTQQTGKNAISIGTPSDSGVILSMGSGIASALKIQAGSGRTYRISDTGNIYKRTTATADTTFAEMGITSLSGINTTNGAVLLDSSMTIGDFVDVLNDNGITASFDTATAKMTIGNAADLNYIIDTPNSELEDLLNITFGASGTYTETERTYYYNGSYGNISSSGILGSRSDNFYAYGKNYTAGASTTFGEMGLTSDGTIIATDADGELYTATVKATDTIASFAANVGATINANGTITFVHSQYEKAYIQSISDNLVDLLELPGSGAGYTYNTTSVNATGDTTFGELGLTSDQTIELRDSYTANVVSSFTITTTTKIKDYIEFLDENDITAGILDGHFYMKEPNEKIYVNPNNTIYSLLNMSTVTKDCIDVKFEISPSDRLTVDKLTTITESTTLGDLGYSSTGTIIVKNTATNDYTTLNVSGTTSIGQILDLTGGKINFDGTITLTEDDDNKIVTSISSDIKEKLKLSGNGYKNRYYNTDSNILVSGETITETFNITEDTLLSKIKDPNDNYTVAITNTQTGAVVEEVFDDGCQVADVLSFLNDNGITAFVSEGKLYTVANGNAFISKNGLAQTFKMSTNMNDYKLETGNSAYLNTASNTLQATVTTTINASTTLSQLGWTSNSNLQLMNCDDLSTTSLAISGTTTVGQILDFAGGKINNDGTITLGEYGSNKAITGPAGLKNIFKLEGIGQGYTYINRSYNTDSNILVSGETITETFNIAEDTLLSKIGVPSGNFTVAITNTQTGAVVEGTFNSTKTVGDVLSFLNDNGITAFVSEGKLYTVANGNSYISKNGLAQYFKMSASMNDYKQVSEEKAYTNTASNKKSVTHSLSSDTTFGDLGISSDQSVTVMENGTQHIITVGAGNTVGDLISALAGYGISGSINNGKITLQGSEGCYILGATSDIKTKLKITTGSGSSYTTGTDSQIINTSSNKLGYSVNGVPVTGSTKISELVGYTHGNGKLQINKNGSAFTIISISTSATLETFFAQLSQYGIDARLDSDGKVYIHSENGTTLTAITGGSNILSALKLSDFSTTTQTNITQSTSDKFSVSEERTLNSDTTLADLGISSDQSVTVMENGTQHIITVGAGNTVGDLISALAGYGISGSINNGKITLQGSEGCYITNMTTNLQTALGLTVGEGNSYTTATMNKTLNTLSDRITYDIAGAPITGSTLVNQLNGYSHGTGKLQINKNGSAFATITIDQTKSLDTFFAQLSQYGFNATVDSQGKVYISADSNMTLSAITGGSNILSTLNMSAFSTTTETDVLKSTSDHLTTNIETTISGSTTLGTLGWSSPAVTINKRNQDGSITTQTLTFASTATVDSLVQALNSNGFTASLVNGKLSVAGDENHWISDSGLKTYFKLDKDTYRSYDDYSAAGNTNSSVIDTATSHTLNSNTTFGQLNMSGEGLVTVVENGTQHVITVGVNSTVGDLISALAGYGISGSINNGKITLQGSEGSYILDVSGNLETALKITAGANNSYRTEEISKNINTSSNKQEYDVSTTPATGTTKFSELATASGVAYNNGSGLVSIKHNGNIIDVTVNSNMTLDEFFNLTAQYGIHGSIDENGYVTFIGDNDNILMGKAGGSNILQCLKLANPSYTTVEDTIGSNSTRLTYEELNPATGADTLEKLINDSDETITFNASGNASIVLEMTSDSGVSTVTLTFAKTDTLNDVIDALKSKGINASVDTTGRFSVNSAVLSDFDISGELGEFLMSDSYVKTYSTNTAYNTSTNLSQSTTINMTDATLLSELGVTNGDIIIRQQGVNYTVNINTTSIKTVGDFRNLISQYGFNSYVDSEGRLSVSGTGDSYISSTADGSNIVENLGIDDWNMSNFSQKSDYLGSSTITVDATDMSAKISQLTDNNGVNLGITSGNIYVYQDGSRNLINIDTNDTLETLATKLAQYGINVGITQDGVLYFDGNNNSYLTTDGLTGASNILNKLGIADNWSTRYNSTSEVLDYEEEDLITANGNTKLSELRDEDGNALNISNGTYYVYQNGVRNSETISDDTTVNDFLSTMSTYGMTANLSSDGSISVGANNNSYLATAATAGEDTNAIDILFEEWNFTNIYTSNGLEIPTDEIRAITRDTKLTDINEGDDYKAGYITLVKDGVKTNISLSADETVGTLIDELALYGFESTINANGQLIIKNSGNSTLENYSVAADASNALDLLGVVSTNWIITNTYEGKTVDVTTTATSDISATRDTLLSEFGVTTGEYYIYNNGVKYTALISSDETIGSLMETLQGFGLSVSLADSGAGSVLQIAGNGNTYVAKSLSATNSSNVVETLFTPTVDQSNTYTSKTLQDSDLVTNHITATEETLLSELNNGVAINEDLSVTMNGVTSTLKITADETVGSFLNKLKILGAEATLNDGEILIQDKFNEFVINADSTNSDTMKALKLVYNDDLGGYMASSAVVEQTVTLEELKTFSVARYADDSTRLDLLNISAGTLSIYRNGEKALIDIGADDTFSTLKARVAAAFSAYGPDAVKMDIIDGYLTFYSDTDGVKIEVGATTDTSNFSAITGVLSQEDGSVKSARELYKVNNESKVTTAGLFRIADVTEGTFYIGDATFTIDENTTIASIVSQINATQEAKATAYWDSIDGKLIINSRTTGASLINIQAGTSNFTDVMGLTTSEWNPDGTLDKTKMIVETQKIGDNARFSINGTYYTSTSNTIDSAVSRIQGLTINLKGVSETGTTITVERDTDTLANAVSDIVDAYNELITNIDKQVAKGSPLDDESTLKLIRNQIRSLMTSSFGAGTTYKNLSAIGITLEAASANNIDTANIDKLTFNKDTFIKAFDADRDALKLILVGPDYESGILSEIEKVVERAVSGYAGYFSSAERSYQNKIDRLNRKIESTQKQVDRYRERLEKKFQAMDLLISKMQNQYSSFLGV